MRKIVLTFGLIAGGIFAVMMAFAMSLSTGDTINFDNAEILGYSSMVLAFLTVFFAIRSYRENMGGGSITFGKGFQVGILVTLIACAVYVVSWEIAYYAFFPDFADKYGAHMIEKMRAKGETQAVIDAATKEMLRFKELYANPFFNVAITFMEVLPIGLVVTLISAGILRRKPSKRGA